MVHTLNRMFNLNAPPLRAGLLGPRVVSPHPQGLQGSHLNLSQTSAKRQRTYFLVNNKSCEQSCCGRTTWRGHPRAHGRYSRCGNTRQSLMRLPSLSSLLLYVPRPLYPSICSTVRETSPRMLQRGEPAAAGEVRTFAELGLRHELSAALPFTAPLEIQRLAWPHLAGGADAILVSEAGSGKTLAYLLPLLHAMLERAGGGEQIGRAGGGEAPSPSRTGRLLLVVPTSVPLCELTDMSGDVSGMCMHMSHRCSASSCWRRRGRCFSARRSRSPRRAATTREGLTN